MKITTKKITKYLEVKVTLDYKTYGLGLYDKEEVVRLKQDLLSTVSEIEEFLENLE